MDAAAIIRQARQRSGLSLRLLAERAGTSHPTLLAYEAGRKVPSWETLERLVHAAGFDLGVALEPLAPFEDRVRRGRQLVDVLELAQQFPTRHDFAPTAGRARRAQGTR